MTAESWSALGAIATIVTALGASIAAAFTAWYVLLTRRVVSATRDAVLEATKLRKAELLLHLLTSYSSDTMHSALNCLRDYRRGFRSDTEMVEHFSQIEKERREHNAKVERPSISNEVESSYRVAEEVNSARREVSRFFFLNKTLFLAGLLEDKELLAKALGKAAFEIYLDVVVPLDEALNKRVLGRYDYDLSVRDFFGPFPDSFFKSKHT